MTDRELMQMALDVLKKLNKDGWILADFEDEVYASIEALRARLAQPEPEPVAWVAYENGEKHGIDFDEDEIAKLPVGTMLYTAPPQRTWVGLTKEEAREISLANRPYVVDMIAALEARLKEKNT